MVSDDAFNTLLNQLAALGRREDQLAILRTWIAGLRYAWDAEHAQQRQETLGKLGGG